MLSRFSKKKGRSAEVGIKTLKMWPEILSVKQENKRELSLTGDSFTSQLTKTKGKVDASLFELKQLNFLQLSHSSLLCEIPADIQSLENLQSLLLFGNQLTSLPCEYENQFIVKLLNHFPPFSFD